jgi:pimeloyl-ACP methyl ester carboxylesterase
MNAREIEVRSGRVSTEGDELYYEIRGSGTPLLMIPAAGGDGAYYAAIADLLSDEFKVITYDRRANSRSTRNEPQNFEIGQQSRDAAAVIRAAGETSAIVFGNSSGAVIALDMAKTQPQSVRAVVSHEAPVPRVLPNAKRWQRFFAACYRTAFRFGSSIAAMRFMFGIRVPTIRLIRAQLKAGEYSKARRERLGEKRIGAQDSVDFLVKQELLPVTNYLPDVRKIRENRVRVVMVVGDWGLARKKWYVQVAQILAKQLGGEVAVFPGHHGSYMDNPGEWAEVLRKLLRELRG